MIGQKSLDPPISDVRAYSEAGGKVQEEYSSFCEKWAVANLQWDNWPGLWPDLRAYQGEARIFSSPFFFASQTQQTSRKWPEMAPFFSVRKPGCEQLFWYALLRQAIIFVGAWKPLKAFEEYPTLRTF